MNRRAWLRVAIAGFLIGMAAVIAGAVRPGLPTTYIAVLVIFGMAATLVGVFLFVIADR